MAPGILNIQGKILLSFQNLGEKYKIYYGDEYDFVSSMYSAKSKQMVNFSLGIKNYLWEKMTSLKFYGIDKDTMFLLG